MTTTIAVSINGNYKTPVTVQHGTEAAVTEVISGRGHAGPFVKNYHPVHAQTLTVSVGPEQEDRSEPETVKLVDGELEPGDTSS
jgi:hypothetical protein